MPHVIVKMFPGRSEQQKTELAQQIVQDMIRIANSQEKSISVAIEEVKPEHWNAKVYQPDIEACWDSLYKKPGYKP